MLLAVTASFAALTALVATSDAVPALDLTVARWVQGVDFPAWTGLLRFAAHLTDKPVGPAILVVCVLALWLRRLPTEVIVLSVAQAIYFPQLWLKELVHRPRPTEDLISITEIGDGFAFPSGHMTLGMAVYGTVAIIALTRLEPGWRRNAILGASGVILILSAISRPAFGAHWPSDALGGVLMGGIWLFVTSRLYLSMRRPGGPPKPLRRPLALAESWLLETTPQRLVQRLRRA
ncbi:MAG: phosphatase PAP2 family protein [Dehalococcoidia bacterium]